MSSLRTELEQILKDYKLNLTQQMGFILSGKHRLDIKTADKIIIAERVQAILTALKTAVLAAAPEKQEHFWEARLDNDLEHGLHVANTNGYNQAIADYTTALQQLFESEG